MTAPRRKTSLTPFAATLIFLLTLAAVSAFGQTGTNPRNESPLPAPTAPVNDYYGVFGAAEKAALDERLIKFNEQFGVEFGVVVIDTTGGRDIFDYSLAVARGWGIGSTAQDNPGALLLVAVDDRKYFTQVSRDLEDELPDGTVGSLQRQFLVPEFRKGNYAKGISDTMDAYMRTFEARRTGQPLPEDLQEEPVAEYNNYDDIFDVVCCLAAIFILILIIASSQGGKGGKGGKGGRGSGGGGSALPWVIGSILANSGGSSGSSWGGGGSDWGGGGGWGGFGGGGDFGGGGAGGGW